MGGTAGILNTSLSTRFHFIRSFMIFFFFLSGCQSPHPLPSLCLCSPTVASDTGRPETSGEQENREMGWFCFPVCACRRLRRRFTMTLNEREATRFLSPSQFFFLFSSPSIYLDENFRPSLLASRNKQILLMDALFPNGTKSSLGRRRYGSAKRRETWSPLLHCCSTARFLEQMDGKNPSTPLHPTPTHSTPLLLSVPGQSAFTQNEVFGAITVRNP